MAIISILVLLGVPKYKEYTKEARITKLTVETKELEKASQQYYIRNNDWPRLSDEPYTAEEVKSFGKKIYNSTGKVVELESDGNYYDIDYGKLSNYISKLDKLENYILQNPVGSVYALEDLTNIRLSQNADEPAEIIEDMQPFIKRIGGSSSETLKSVVVTKDGGYITVGNTYSIDGDFLGLQNKGSVDAIAIKYNKQGNVEWIKRFGGSGYDYSYTVKQTRDEGFVITGKTASKDGDFIGVIQNGSGTLVKLDKFGELTFVKSLNIGSDTTNNTIFADVIETQDNGYLTVGYYTSSLYNSVVIKHSELGVEEWRKGFYYGVHTTMNSVSEAQDDGYIIVGQAIGDSAKIIKLNSSGVPQWETHYLQGNYGSGNIRFNDVEKTKDNGYIVVGSNNDSSYRIVKFNNDGALIKDAGGSFSTFNSFYDVIVTNDNEFIAVGYTGSKNGGSNTDWDTKDGIIVKYDSELNEVWKKRIGGSKMDILNSIDLAADGDYIIVGDTRSVDVDLAGTINKGYDDTILIRMDSSGNFK